MRLAFVLSLLCLAVSAGPALACRTSSSHLRSLFAAAPVAPPGALILSGRLTRYGPEFDAAVVSAPRPAADPEYATVGEVGLFAVLIQPDGVVVEVYKSNIVIVCDDAFRLVHAPEVEAWIVLRPIEAPGVSRGRLMARTTSGDWIED